MKKLRGTYSLIALSFALSATAAPTQYHLTATHVGEIDWITDTQPVFVNSGLLFSTGTTMSATFSYDADTPLTSTIPGDGINRGDADYYMGPVTQFSAEVSGHTFSSNRGDTFVYDWVLFGDSSGNQYHSPPVITTVGGEYPLPTAPTNFHGFSLGDYTLMGYMLAPFGGFDPEHPLSTIPNFTQVSLTFENSDGARRTVVFRTSEITPVPLPAGFWLFASGIAGLITNRLRKGKLSLFA